MDSGNSKLTVFFEDPFWVGVFERNYGGMYQVCKVTFGAEPKEYDILEFVKRNWREMQFSEPVPSATIPEERINPKRAQREASALMHVSGVGTKAQQALQLQYEENKLERKTLRKQAEDEKIQRVYQLRKEKKKDKQKGH